MSHYYIFLHIVLLLRKFYLISPFLPVDQLRDFQGHRVRVVTISYFPYIDYEKEKDKPGAAVLLKDSLDTRILETLAEKLNFT